MREKERMLTVKEVSEMLGVSRNTVYVWIREGMIKVFKFKRIIRIPESEVEKFLANRFKGNSKDD
jgi:excisionase family DNA binding protein